MIHSADHLKDNCWLNRFTHFSFCKHQPRTVYKRWLLLPALESEVFAEGP